MKSWRCWYLAPAGLKVDMNVNAANPQPPNLILAPQWRLALWNVGAVVAAPRNKRTHNE
jgi:hypothetical protein